MDAKVSLRLIKYRTPGLRVLELLSQDNLTASQIYGLLDGKRENIRAILCKLVKQGYAFNMGRHECSTCHHPAIIYKITPLGKQYLKDRIN